MCSGVQTWTGRATTSDYVETGLVNEQAMGKEAIDYLISLHPLGRIAQPEEIAHAVIFLIENEFVTGLSLVVDGGYTAQ